MHKENIMLQICFFFRIFGFHAVRIELEKEGNAKQYQDP